VINRNRTPSEYKCYALYFYFLGLSLRRTLQRISSCFIKRNYVSIWNCTIQRYKPEKILANKSKIMEFIIDETLVKVGSEFIWLWVVAIEFESKERIELPYLEREICS
jgi:putative transposase